MRLFPILAAAIALAAPVPALAQQQDEQLWEQLNVVLPVAKGVRVTAEQIARTSDRQEGIYTTEYGVLVGVQIAKGVELGVGYRHVGFFNANTAADEERIRQQIVIARGRFAGRLRLDERFNPGGDEIGFRVRPLVRYNLPLGRSRVSLFGSHESFILPNSTVWGQRAGYERMRNIVGVNVPIGKALSADIGYLNQYRLARGGARAQMDHALTVQLTVNLDKLGIATLHD
ncbi:DUF2490 domain-containing protein [Sphingomonas yantingensis]|uniref:DUF2490 domain-containing protein n=1 Tax=Sphingomonas yantingensis TaxID=1241761 RepID=A0A7W9AP13_9SPHN|nr:DUF2490 domain-containing protein [Sphingomonas yantingensis]MBB5697952.1 hypothetical protein [Sphingomonas yantingensis]